MRNEKICWEKDRERKEENLEVGEEKGQKGRISERIGTYLRKIRKEMNGYM
jgi:hypothetical protein